jgi:hypothetical protein
MKPHAIAVAVVLAVAVLFVGYVVGYYALPTPIFQGSMGYPHYRAGGEISSQVFMPIHRLDRRLRPDYWGRLPGD